MKAQRRFAPAGVAAMDQNKGLLSIGIAGRNPLDWVAIIRRIGTTTCMQIEVRDAGICTDRKEELEAWPEQIAAI
jgi:hypothetical protein